MKYITDAHLSGLARELRSKGIDCDTVHKYLRGTEDSSIAISDPEIIRSLRGSRDDVTLITLDSELAEYCAIDDIPCIRVQDLVGRYIRETTEG